jgi:hypothetical protein
LPAFLRRRASSIFYTRRRPRRASLTFPIQGSREVLRSLRDGMAAFERSFILVTT